MEEADPNHIKGGGRSSLRRGHRLGQWT
uniref:ORF1 n=1 Tax=Porcine circovirus 2 TaxID=85708 RepID=I3UMP5_PCV2|nr:ORF1 [Porcine circovirus 2]